MKIRDGRIEYCDMVYKGEVKMRENLSSKLDSWFGLRLSDLPEILKGIGVKSKNYDIEDLKYEDFFEKVSFNVKTRSTKYVVEMFKGNMEDPYPHFKISRNGKSKWYQVKKIIQIEQLI